MPGSLLAEFQFVVRLRGSRTSAAMKRLVASNSFEVLSMVKIDPKNVRVTLPDAYLLAIGKVCAQWAVLEANVEFILIKLAGMDHDDVRGKILVNHMSWPQKLDNMSALVDQLLPDYPRLRGYDTEVVPLLKKAATASCTASGARRTGPKMET